jgi:hypothetical protein
MPVAAATMVHRFKNKRREMLNRWGRAEFEEKGRVLGRFDDMEWI